MPEDITTPERPVTQGQLIDAQGQPLPLERTELEADIAGPVARVQLRQVFRNPRDRTIEATYRFPMPAEAAVHQMRFRIGDRVVEAEVQEKEAARRTFNAARAAGQTATLLEEDRPALFTLSVTNLPAGAEVIVELSYDELLGYQDGRWRFAFPLTAPDLYLDAPPAKGDGPRPPRRPSPDRIGVLHAELRLRGAAELRSPSHPVTVVGDEALATVVLTPGAPTPNRDLVLDWKASDAGVRPSIWFHRGEDGPATFLLALTPSAEAGPRKPTEGLSALRCGNCGGLVDDPTEIAEIPGIGPAFRCEYCGAILAPSTVGPVTRATRPRDVLILVDRSASMRGALPQAAAAVKTLLEALPAGDRAQVVAFDHERQQLEHSTDRFASLTPELIKEAEDFVAGLRARGGTELDAALKLVGEAKVEKDRTPLVVLITDGAVGNEGRLLRELPEQLGERRLYVLGLGQAVDRRLIKRLATVGGGASEVIVGDDPEALSSFARRVRRGGPVLTGLTLRLKGAEVEDLLPNPLPDLFGGQPVLAFGRSPSAGKATLLITASTHEGRPFRQELTVEIPSEAVPVPGLERLWARRKVDALHAAGEAEEATALALTHGLLSPGTSLVAVDSEAPPLSEEERVKVAQVRMDDAPPKPRSKPGPSREPGPSRGGAPSSKAAPKRPSPRRRRRPSRGIDDAEMIDVKARPMPLSSDLLGGKLSAAPEPAPAAPPPPSPAPASPASPPTSTAPRRPPSSPRRKIAAKTPAPRSSGLGSRLGELVDAIRGGLGGGSAEDSAEEPAERESAGQAEAPKPPQPPKPFELLGEPYPDAELRFFQQHASGALDLVFLVDETGSMGAYIQQVQRRLLELIDAVESSALCRSLRIGLVTYRDHPPQDRSYPSRKVALTDDFKAIRMEVNKLRASGGGDGPESVTDGLWEVVRMSWRPEAARTVVWFGDAPPHGVEPRGDGFPNGCPCGHHWYTQAESCREMGVVIHGVGCLPALRRYVGAEEVFRTVARTTGGSYVPLTRAELLVPVILGAAEAELDRQRLVEHLALIAKTWQDDLAATDEAERLRWLTKALRDRGVQPRVMDFHGELTSPPPMRFRRVETADVAVALDRLRAADRVSF